MIEFSPFCSRYRARTNIPNLYRCVWIRTSARFPLAIQIVLSCFSERKKNKNKDASPSSWLDGAAGQGAHTGVQQYRNSNIHTAANSDFSTWMLDWMTIWKKKRKIPIPVSSWHKDWKYPHTHTLQLTHSFCSRQNAHYRIKIVSYYDASLRPAICFLGAGTKSKKILGVTELNRYDIRASSMLYYVHKVLRRDSVKLHDQQW